MDANAGFVDLLIESKNLYTVVEFKNIELPFLNWRTSKTTKQKTEDLTDMSLTDMLQLQFHKRDKFRTRTIQKWVDGGSVRSTAIVCHGSDDATQQYGKELRAFAAVIIGSCITSGSVKSGIGPLVPGLIG